MFNKFFLDNRAVYDIMWTNTVQPDRLQRAIGRMRISCWILEQQTHTQNL